MKKTDVVANGTVNEDKSEQHPVEDLLDKDVDRWVTENRSAFVARLINDGTVSSVAELNELVRPYIDENENADGCDRCPPSIEEFVDSLEECGAYWEATEVLFRVAPFFDLDNVRCYLYDTGRKELVGVDAAGHTSAAVMLLRAGKIAKSLDSLPNEKSDAFWCLRQNEPVLVEVSASAKLPVIGRRRPDGLLTIEVREQCEQLARYRHGPMHVDICFPDWLGKVSSDFVDGIVPDDATEKITTFNRYVRIAGRYISSLYFKSIEGPLSSARIELRLTSTISEVGQVCVSKLRRILQFETAQFYTVTKDALGSQLVVLLSNSDGEENESTLCFRPDEVDVVAWVAKNKRAVVLENCDKDEFRQQLAAYGIQKEFTKRIFSKGRFEGFIATPVIDSGGEVRAVYCVSRFSACADKRFLSDSDHLLLRKVASEAIAPAIESAKKQQLDVKVPEHWQIVNRISVRDYGAFTELMEELQTAVRSLAPEGESRKLALLNLVQGTSLFRHFHIGGSLPRRSRLFQEFPVDGSFTGRVLRSTDGFYYLNDLDKAADAGAILRIAKDAVCALGARVSLDRYPGNRKDFGAIVLMSDRHDLHPDEHGAFLRILAKRTAENLARREIHSGLLQGLESEITAAQHSMRLLVEQLRGDNVDQMKQRDINSVLSRLLQIASFNEEALDASAEFMRPHRLDRVIQPFNVREAVSAVGAAIGGENRIRNEIRHDLVVKARRSVFMSILYKLLKYAPRPSSRATAIIQGQIVTNRVGKKSRSETDLQISVDGLGTRNARNSFDELFHWDPVTESRPLDASNSNVLRRMGCTMAWNLAKSHVVSDGRFGQLDIETVPSDRCARVVLKLPIESDPILIESAD